MDEKERSTEDILQDIAREEKNLSKTVEQIGERIKEKLDWHEYVKNYPYWALGTATVFGYFASKVFAPRTTPIERIMGSLAEEVRDSLGGLHVGATGPSLAQVTLLGVGTKLATEWIKNAISTSGSSGVRPPPQTEDDSTICPEATT